jgi:MtN3 and saliva related transmembrane protein
MQLVSVIGFVAGGATVAAYAPQAWRAWRTRKTADLSWGMIILLLAAAVLWITYGIMSRDWPVIATNVGTLTLNIAIAWAKVRFG